MENRLLAEAKAQFGEDINLYRASLTQAINNKVSLISGLNTYLENELLFNNLVIEDKEMISLIVGIYEDSSGIRNIALAPGGVMQFVYPYEENKSVIGYEPITDTRPSVRADVHRAIATNQVILSLPIELIQGGKGIIARKAVFVNDEYWGLANIVIDLSALLTEAGITSAANTIELAISDQSGRVFYGSSETFAKEPVTYPVILPEGFWTLAGIPANGWHSMYQQNLQIYRLLGISIGILLTVLTYLVAYRQSTLSALVAQRTKELEQDIQKRKQVEQSLRESEAQATALIDAIPDLMFRLDHSGVILDYRAEPEQLYTGDQSIFGRKVQDLLPPELGDKIMTNLNITLRSGQPQIFDYQLQLGENQIGDFEARMIVSGENEVIAIIRDITQKKRAEERLRHIATHDSLTTLPNRDLFSEHLVDAIEAIKQTPKKLAVLFIDLDNFKAVNDAFGHKQGDWLLQFITQRLRTTIGENVLIARFGGDEFVLLIQDIEQDKDILPIVKRIAAAISAPLMLHGSEVFITSSIGISLFPKDGQTPDDLIENADRAMYQAKQDGKDDYKFFKPSMQKRTLERLELRNQIRQAINQQEFLLHYQPQINLHTGQIFGVEALLRWQHPSLGLIKPGKFIQVAEETGMITRIGQWVLRDASEQLQTWTTSQMPGPRLAINISGPELRKGDIVKQVQKILKETKIPPELLELEMSENIVFQDLANALSQLKELKSLGIRIAIDDFGSGYSTLSQIANFPFDTLKIDQYFARRVTTSSKDAAIVNGIMTIAQNLNLDVIAEGVETEAQLAFYRNIGCHNIQGYLFSRPLPANKIETVLREGITRTEN